VGKSNRVQGNVKKGKSSDSNSYEALSNQDDDDEEEEIGKNPMNWVSNLTPDEENASDKEERQTINKKKGITEFFTPKIQHKKKTSSDGIKATESDKQAKAEVGGRQGKQDSNINLNKSVAKGVVAPLVSALKTKQSTKELGPDKPGETDGTVQEIVKKVEGGSEQGSAKGVGEKISEQLPPVQIREKSTIHSGSVASKGKGGTPCSKLSDTPSSGS
jgi:hypothetical protein